jgi:folate-binding protein YgfZ
MAEILGLRLAGEAEWETFRICRGIPAVPAELNRNHTPLESDVGALVSSTKGCYVGQEVIARLDAYEKVQRKLCQMEIQGDPGPVPVVLERGGEEVGVLTSVTRNPGNEAYCGLAYLKISAMSGPQRFMLRGVKNRVEARPREQSLFNS